MRRRRTPCRCPCWGNPGALCKVLIMGDDNNRGKHVSRIR